MLSDHRIRELAAKHVGTGNFRFVLSSLTSVRDLLAESGLVVVDLAELEAALKPFAKAATDYYGEKPTSDETELFGWLEARHITWGDLRRAAALLAAITQEGRG